MPHVTVIRPCKGLEPYLYECLASTFHQDYPGDKIAVHFCVASRSDPAYATIVKVVADHPDRHARVFIEEEDDGLANGDEEESRYRTHLGPNPKIRNMSKAYREAGKNDLIWIIDCNVWAGRGVCGRMVDRLCGFTREGQPSAVPNKLVHHLPISVDVASYYSVDHVNGNDNRDSKVTVASSYDIGSSVVEPTTTTTTTIAASTDSSSNAVVKTTRRLSQYGGGRLEELFLSSSHAKMYVAINTVAVAPCIVGKSTMFRREHLDHLTLQKALEERKKRKASRSSKGDDGDATVSPLEASVGIDYFSHNICEDHLIGDMLWKSPVPALPSFPKKMRHHGLVFGDLAIQPICAMSVGNYVSRRVRWLRVRKFTVPVATLVEPGTESFLCSAMGAWGLTTLDATSAWAGSTWPRLAMWWCVSVFCWMCVDWTVYLLLHSGRTVETTRIVEMKSGTEMVNEVPAFAQPPPPTSRGFGTTTPRRPFTTWLAAWLGREALALPIWTWAIWGGTSVTWREGRYWVGLDMRVHEIKESSTRKQKKAPGQESSAVSDVNGHALGQSSVNGSVSSRRVKVRAE